MTAQAWRRPTEKAAQAGVSLISTMVGIVIGLSSVLAILTLYLAQARQIEGTSTEAGTRQMSARNGQLAVSLMLLQVELQQAGFRIEDAELGTDLVTVTNPAGQITALGWNWREGGVVECAAMRYVATADAGAATERGRVDLLRRVSPCVHSPANPTTLFDAADAADIEVVAADIPRLNITVESEHDDCTIGADPDPATAENGARVEMSARLSLAGFPVRNQFCLYNIL